MGVLRGKKDQAAAILEEIVRSPNLAPTRVLARAGVNYNQVRKLESTGLFKKENIKANRTRPSLTEKGRLFLQHYRACNELLPN
ncbi:MAG: hypothetical protein ABSG57_02825 [Candidatus Bathyarchaeia archaeon]